MIDVREAGVQDAAAIAALFRDTRATCMPYLPAFHTPSEDLVFFGNCIEQETVWVAEDDEMCGFCAFGHGWLDHLYVSPTHQGRGIGSTRLKIAIDASDVLDAWVFQGNTHAIEFYAHHGFVLIEKTDGSKNEERMPDALYRFSKGVGSDREDASNR